MLKSDGFFQKDEYFLPITLLIGGTSVLLVSYFLTNERKKCRKKLHGIPAKHPSWHISGAPRAPINLFARDVVGNTAVQDLLKKYDIDILNGFLPTRDPLQRLPHDEYKLWEQLGDDLPKLLGARMGQARGPLGELPVISSDFLISAKSFVEHIYCFVYSHTHTSLEATSL